MNSQKQDQGRQQQQQQQQQQIIGGVNPQFSSNNITLNGQTGNASPIQSQQMFLSQPQLQQQQLSQVLSNSQKNNSKSFTSVLSGVNDPQVQQNQAQTSQLQQQQTQQQQNPSQLPQNAKGFQISAFTIKIIDGKLKLANSVDLKPFVQVQFGKRIWRTQIYKGSYPKWNEEKRFEVNMSKGFDLNNPNGICSSSTTTQSSCSSISPQPSQNQQNQIFQQQQLLNGSHPGVGGGFTDWNIEILVLHKSQNEEIEIGRKNLNVEKQNQMPQWVIIENNSEIFGSVQIQFQFEYTNFQLQINKSSHQIYVNQKVLQKQQQQQQQQQITYPQFNYYKGIDDGQNTKQQQSNVNSTAVNSLTHTPIISNNKRNPSSHSETSSFQDFQFIPQTTSRMASMNQNYQDIPETLSKLQLSYSTHISSNQNGNNPNMNNNNLGYSFRQYDIVNLINQLQMENDMLMKKDRDLQDRFVQAQLDSSMISKEQSKLEQQQNNIKMQEVLSRQKLQGLEQQKDDFEKKISKLEESKMTLQAYIQEYQNLVAEEQEIIRSNSKLKSDINLMSEEEPQVQDTLNILSKKNNSEILQLKIFKLKMINHLKEVNSIFYNRKPVVGKGVVRSYHQRAKSYSNHVSFGVDTITDYTVALKNLQNKISDLKFVINSKNCEIEQLRDQITSIQSNYNDQ